MTFENAKKHLCSVFSNIENQKVNLEADLEELLKYSYGIMQKKRATKIIEQQLGHNIVPVKKQTHFR